MSDDINPLESRITKIVGQEERLNKNRISGMKAKTDHRNAEKRQEGYDLASLDREKADQLKTNSAKESKFQESLKREGEALVDLSKEIRDDYIAELRHREQAKEKLQAKVAALESKLRGIEGARPS